MKPFFLRISTLIFLSVLLHIPQVAKASPMAGAYMHYRQLIADSVKLHMIIFRDCTGIPVDSTAPINVRTIGVTPQKSANITMRRTSIQQLSATCNTTKSICEGGSFPFGAEAHHFEVSVNLQQLLGGLSSSYCRIKFSYQMWTFNGTVTNIALGPFYIESEFNRCLVTNNRSPVAQNLTFPVICNGVPFRWNPGLLDSVDYDSISYHSIPVYSGETTTNTYLGNYSEDRPLNFIGFPNTGLPFPSGFSFDPYVGQLSFTSNALQVPVFSFEYKEYRNINGTYSQIGYTRMVFQTYTTQCPPNNVPTLIGYPVNNVFVHNINAGAKTCVSYAARDTATNDTTYFEWNKAIGAGATFQNYNTYSSSAVKNDSATICWTPDIIHARSYPYYFALKYADRACPSNAINIRPIGFRVSGNNVPRIYTNNGNRNFSFRLNISLASSLNTQWVVPPTGNAVFDTTGATTYNNTNQVASHTFSTPGRYVIRVRYTFNGTTFTFMDTVNVCNFKLDMVKDTTTCQGSSITLQPTRTGGVGPFTYSWSSSATDTNQSITKTPLSNTLYRVTVKDSSNCIQTDSVLVRVNMIPQISLGADRSFCFNDSVRFQFSFLNTTYLWNDNTTSGTKSFSNSGTYWIKATNQFGCSKTDTVVLTKTTQLFSFNAGIDKDICIRDSVQIGASATGTATVNYAWSPATALSAANISMPKASPAVTTNYIVTASDSNNCRIKDTVVVTVRPFISINLGADRNFCFYDSVVLDGGAGAASYLWQNNSTSRYYLANTSGTYYVRNIHPTSNCVFTDTVVLNKTAAFTFNAGPDRSTCVSDTVTIGGFAVGTGTFTYAWSPTTALSSATAARPVANPASTITYAVTASDVNGCFIRDSVKVTVSGNASLNFGPDRYFCFYDSVRLDAGAGAGSYLWQNNSSNRYFTVYNTGTYWCTTVSGGCTRKDTVVLTKSTAFTVDAGNNTTICAGDSITIGNPASGSTGWFTYAWTPVTGLSSSTLAQPKAAPVVTTKYYTNATDTHSCLRRDSITISVIQGTAINLGSDRSFCFYDSVRLDAGAGAASYLWQNNSTGRYFNVNNTGLYWCEVSNGTCLHRDSIYLTKTNSFSINAGTDKTICRKDSVTIGNTATGTGTFTYRWSPKAGVSDTTAAMPKVSPTVTTNYILTVTDSSGCVRKDSVIVNVFSPTVNAGLDTGVCIGDTVRIGLSVSGRTPITLRWLPNTRITDSSILQPRVFPLNSTNYILTATDSGGCVSRDTVLVNVYNLPQVNAGGDVTICENDTTQLYATVNSAFSYAINWSPATGLVNAGTLTPLALPTTTTNYVLRITDTKGCIGRDTVKVNVRPKPGLNFATTATACTGDSITIGDTAISGNPIYSYLWTPSAGLYNPLAAKTRLKVTGAATYKLTAEDVFGCKNTRNVAISSLVVPTANAGNDTLMCAGVSVKIGKSATGTGLSYLWTPATGLNSATILQPTATPLVTTPYILTVTNSIGCKKSDTVVLNTRIRPVAEAGINRTACAGDTIKLDGSYQTNGAIGPFTISWSPSTWLSSTNILSPIASLGSTVKYYLNVSDSIGCNHKDSVTLTLKAKPVPNAGADKYICLSTSSVFLLGSGGSNYYWSLLSSPTTIIDSTNFISVQPPASTAYLLKVNNPSDGRTCFAYDTVVVNVNHLTPISFTNKSLSFCTQAGISNLNAAGASPAGGFWYTSNSGYVNCFDTTNKTFNPACYGGGTHYLQYVYRLGYCTIIDSVSVTFYTPTNFNGGVDKVLCHYDKNILLQTTPSINGITWSVSPACANCITSVGNQFLFQPNNALPNTVYKIRGTYTNIGNCNTADSMLYTVGRNVNADFTANPLIGSAPLNVNFTNTSSIPFGLWSWNFGDVFNPGSNTSTASNTAHWYTQQGSYTIRLIATDTSRGVSCSDTTIKLNYLNIGPNGTGVSIDDNSIRIYPNPAQTEFTVVLPDPDVYTISLFDVTGKKVNEITANKQNEVLVRRNQLAVGVYLLQVINSKGEIKTVKIVFE